MSVLLRHGHIHHLQTALIIIIIIITIIIIIISITIISMIIIIITSVSPTHSLHHSLSLPLIYFHDFILITIIMNLHTSRKFCTFE